MNSRSLNNAGRNIGVPFLWILVVMDLTFQLFNFLPFFDRHYIFWLIGFILILLYSRGYFSSKPFLWMVGYIMIVFLNYISGDSYFNSWNSVFAKEMINFLFPACLTYYLFRHSDYHLFGSLLVVFGALLLESTIVSSWANSIYPGIMRLQSNAENIEINASILQPFRSIGLSDYEFPHAIPVIIPGIVFALKKNSKRVRSLLVVLLATLCVLVYVSGSFTALLLTTMTLIMSLIVDVHKERNTLRKIMLVGLLMVPFAVNTQLQLFTIRSVQSVFPEESLPYRKFEDIHNSIMVGTAEGSVEKRQEKYDATWKAVSENLLLGTNDSGVGGHSSIPDRLAMLGLVGMIPFVLFLFNQLKYTLRYLNRTNRYYYYVGILGALIMMFTKNMSTLSMWLFLFTLLPGLLWWSEAKSNVR